MVNMIGFHPPSPNYNAAGYGEPGHYFSSRETSGGTLVRFPCGRALFTSPEEARAFLGHPGDIGHAARYYLERRAA